MELSEQVAILNREAIGKCSFPREPTEKMIAVGAYVIRPVEGSGAEKTAKKIWEAMWETFDAERRPILTINRMPAFVEQLDPT